MANTQRQLVFGGCGGMYHYMGGIASVIQENFQLGPETIISGSSAGCFPGMLLALGMNIDEMFETWNIPFLQEVNTYRFGALGHWNNAVRRWTRTKLPENAYQQLSGRFHISLTSVPDLKNHIIGDWNSNEDLIEGVMTSSFIPVFDLGKLTSSFRGKSYVDGSLTNSFPLPLGNDVPSCIIKRDMWRPNNISWLWCWTDEEWARKLFTWGKEDASDHLEEIASVLKSSDIVEIY
jgi:hypothetical protein